jgi:hypothetical protein
MKEQRLRKEDKSWTHSLKTADDSTLPLQYTPSSQNLMTNTKTSRQCLTWVRVENLCTE